MKYADIKEIDVANGPGIRVSLFVSGCRHKCKGCFNYIAWDFNYGNEYTDATQKYILGLLDKSYIKGFTFLGGEPLELENQSDVLNLIRDIRFNYPNKNIWLYTGFTYEYLNECMTKKSPFIVEILNSIDVMVDGKFEEDKKDLNLRFRGSANQRLIDMKRTIKEKKVILWDI